MSFAPEGPHAAETSSLSSVPYGSDSRSPLTQKQRIVRWLDSVLVVSHRPPRNPVLFYLWKWRVKIETALTFPMLVYWEILLVYSILALFWVLLYFSIKNYFPSHIAFLRRRTAYYIFGDENKEIIADMDILGKVKGLGAVLMGAVNSGSLAAAGKGVGTARRTGGKVLTQTVYGGATGHPEL